MANQNFSKAQQRVELTSSINELTEIIDFYQHNDVVNVDLTTALTELRLTDELAEINKRCKIVVSQVLTVKLTKFHKELEQISKG